MLGYPEAALADTNHALGDAREIGQAATLMCALVYASMCHIHCGNYAAANAQLDEVVALAEEKGAFLWKTLGMFVATSTLWPDRQSAGRSPDDRLWNHRIAINGINNSDAIVLVISGEPSSIMRGCFASWR